MNPTTHPLLHPSPVPPKQVCSVVRDKWLHCPSLAGRKCRARSSRPSDILTSSSRAALVPRPLSRTSPSLFLLFILLLPPGRDVGYRDAGLRILQAPRRRLLRGCSSRVGEHKTVSAPSHRRLIGLCRLRNLTEERNGEKIRLNVNWCELLKEIFCSFQQNACILTVLCPNDRSGTIVHEFSSYFGRTGTLFICV